MPDIDFEMVFYDPLQRAVKLPSVEGRGTMMYRSPICNIPEQYLEPIQRGTLVYEWKGILCLKNPFDLALYLRLLWQVKPATIIEVGSYSGGSAVWFSDMTAAMGLQTRIVSVDITPPELTYSRVEFLAGSASALGDVLTDTFMQSLARPLLVIEDSSHQYEHSLATLRFFDEWLSPGEYICVEDGIINSFSVEDRYEGGPNRAIDQFLEQAEGRYEIDQSYCDYYGHNVTWNTNGYLRRTQAAAVGEGARSRQASTGLARVASIGVNSDASGTAFALALRTHDRATVFGATLRVVDAAGCEICSARSAAREAPAWRSFDLNARLSGRVTAGQYQVQAELWTPSGELIDTKATAFDIVVEPHPPSEVTLQFDS